MKVRGFHRCAKFLIANDKIPIKHYKLYFSGTASSKSKSLLLLDAISKPFIIQTYEIIIYNTPLSNIVTLPDYEGLEPLIGIPSMKLHNASLKIYQVKMLLINSFQTSYTKSS